MIEITYKSICDFCGNTRKTEYEFAPMPPMSVAPPPIETDFRLITPYRMACPACQEKALRLLDGASEKLFGGTVGGGMADLVTS